MKETKLTAISPPPSPCPNVAFLFDSHASWYWQKWPGVVVESCFLLLRKLLVTPNTMDLFRLKIGRHWRLLRSTAMYPRGFIKWWAFLHIMNPATDFIRCTERVIRSLGWRNQLFCVWAKKATAMNKGPELNVFLTVHHELTVYWLPTWCTSYYLFVK